MIVELLQAVEDNVLLQYDTGDGYVDLPRAASGTIDDLVVPSGEVTFEEPLFPAGPIRYRIDGGSIMEVPQAPSDTPVRVPDPVLYLLDEQPTAKLPISLEKLSTTYEGSAIRVRRSSDSTEQDIGFDGRTLDEASLLTFCGVGDGFVVTAYNQLGGGNVTQATAGAQPYIVEAGVVCVDENGKPAMKFISRGGTECVLSGTIELTSNRDITVMAVVRKEYGSAEGNYQIVAIGPSLGYFRFVGAVGGAIGSYDVAPRIFVSDLETATQNSLDEGDTGWMRWPCIQSCRVDGTAMKLWRNRVELRLSATHAVPETSSTAIHIGRTTDQVAAMYLSTVIVREAVTDAEVEEAYDILESVYEYGGGREQAEGSLIRQGWGWMNDLYDWMATLVEADFDLSGITEIDWDETVPARLENAWLAVGSGTALIDNNPSTLQSFKASPKHFVLDDGASHGVEGTGAVRLFVCEADGIEAPALATWYVTSLPNASGDANPYYGNEAVALRALTQAAASMMHWGFHQDGNLTYLGSTDFTGGTYAPVAYVYRLCKDVLSAPVQAAFEAGLKFAVWTMRYRETHAINTNMDLFCGELYANVRADTTDANLQQMCLEGKNMLLYGSATGTPATSTGVYRPFGGIVEGGSPETTYSGQSQRGLANMLALTLGMDGWEDLEDVNFSMLENKNYQTFEETDGYKDGPSGYAGRTGGSLWNDQANSTWRDVLLATLFEEGLPGRWSVPATQAALIAAIQSNLAAYNLEGITQQAVEAHTPNIFTDLNRRQWAIKDTYYPPDTGPWEEDNWWEYLVAVQAAGGAPVQLPTTALASYNRSLDDQFWAFKANGVSWFIETMDYVGLYHGWYGGGLQGLKVDGYGIVSLARHNKSGPTPEQGENTRDWSVMDEWATHHICGQTSVGAFSSACANPTQSVTRSFGGSPPSVITTSTNAGNYAEEVAGVLTGDVSFTLAYYKTADGIRCVYTLASDEEDSRLEQWAVFTVLLRWSYQSTDTVIAYWTGSSWQPMSTTIVETEWIRLGRDQGEGVEYEWLSFPTPTRVCLSDAVYVQNEGRLNRHRNIKIDMHGNPGVDTPFPATTTTEISLVTTDPELVATAPSVGITFPEEGDDLPAGGWWSAQGTVDWNELGAGDVYLEWSDDGETWTTVDEMVNTTGDIYEFTGTDASLIPSGVTNIRMRAVPATGDPSSASMAITSNALTLVLEDNFTAANGTAIDPFYEYWTTNTTGNSWQPLAASGNAEVNTNRGRAPTASAATSGCRINVGTQNVRMQATLYNDKEESNHATLIGRVNTSTGNTGIIGPGVNFLGGSNVSLKLTNRDGEGLNAPQAGTDVAWASDLTPVAVFQIVGRVMVARIYIADVLIDTFKVYGISSHLQTNWVAFSCGAAVSPSANWIDSVKVWTF